MSALVLPGAAVDPRELDGGEASLTRFLRSLPGVDRVGLEARTARLATRSLKHDTKRALIDVAISTMDLTTLEGADTPSRVRSLCARALRPDPADASVPHVAAVCVYSDLVPHCGRCARRQRRARGRGRDRLPVRSCVAGHQARRHG